MGDCPILSPALIGREIMSIQDGYSICFNEWALDSDIKNELGLLLIISSLSAEQSYCFAKNSYLAELFNIDEVSISRKIKKLEEKGYIEIEYDKRGCEVLDRKIRLTKISIDDLQKNQSTINKNVKDNNIINKNNNKEIYKEKKKVVSRAVKQMTIPEKQEVIDYCKSLNLDGEKIFNYYDVADWHDASGKPVLNWKQKIRAVWDKPENKVKTVLNETTVGETEEDKEIIKDNIFIKNTTILARIKTGSLVLVNIMNELMRLANKEETAKKILETMRESELTDVQVEYIRKYLTSKITKV